MIRFLLLSFAFALCLHSQAQPCKGSKNGRNYTNKCAKIVSILVDACGTPEGENEIVLMATGNNSISLSSLSFSWANTSNKWLGLTQNATTASKLASINATITGCGKLIAPAGGIIPANSLVYVFTSTAFTVGSNSFVNLNDSAYAIFQSAGNTAGHFSNYATPAGLRTTILRISGACSDTATYERTDLLKQNGTKGAEDGATVDFDEQGNPSYKNNACQVPNKTLKTTILPPANTTLCNDDSALLTGLVEGADCFVWRSKNGRFSDTTSLITRFYPQTGSAAAELWAFNCKTSSIAKITFNINVSGKINAGRDTIVCGSKTVQLKASGGTWGYKWIAVNGKGNLSNDTLFQTTYVPATSDTVVRFIVKANGTCSAGNDTTLARFVRLPSTAFTLSDTSICENEDSVYLIPQSKGGVFKSILQLSSTPAFWPSPPGIYSIVYTQRSGFCRDSTRKTVVVYPNPDAGFSFIPAATVLEGTSVSLKPNGIKPLKNEWFEKGVRLASTTFVKTIAGKYTILQRVTDSLTGCTDTFSSILTVVEEDGIRMANVFTPNGDSLNEIFNFIGNGVINSNLKVFNRWGEKLFESSDPNRGWNGKTVSGAICPDGAYFWQLYVQLAGGKKQYISGSVTLIR